MDGSYSVEKGGGAVRASYFRRKLELTDYKKIGWTEEDFPSIQWHFPGSPFLCSLCCFLRELR